MELELRAVGLEVRFWNRLNLAELVGLAAVLAAGFGLVRSGAITIGQATAAALYFHQLFGPIGTVLGGFDELQRAAAGLARLVGVLQLPARPPAVRVSGQPAATIELRGVGYRYPSAAAPALREVDLTVAAGETVALVGRTGAGKSTLAGLVAGVLDGDQGQVLLDGRPVEATHSGPGDRGVALVTQEAHVFAGTLREDLRLAKPDAEDGELAAALATAGRWAGAGRCRTGWTPSSAPAGARCRRSRRSGWPWPAATSPRPGCWCWTRPPPRRAAPAPATWTGRSTRCGPGAPP